MASTTSLLKSGGDSNKVYDLQRHKDIDQLIIELKEKTGSSPWHFSNLYDLSSNSFFIPYHLWSGASWDGKKSVQECIHHVDSVWQWTDFRKKQRKAKIVGPVNFTHPLSGLTLNTFEWKSKKSSQYLICHERGLARIYDPKFEKAGLLSSPVLNGTECKFPAGFGWKIGVPRDCNPKAPKQTTLTRLTFDKEFNLIRMAYTYTIKEGFSARRADDYYEYAVDKGRVLHTKLPE